MPVFETIVIYVALMFIDQFLIEEGYGRLKRLLFPTKKYKNRLIVIIYNTIEEFEKSHPYDSKNGMFPFYHSKIFFENLTMFILFKKGSLNEIIGDFDKCQNIIQPTKQDLEEFYSLFAKNTNNDKVLKTTFIEESYKGQIFEITQTINEIKEISTSIKADTSFLVEESLSKKLTVSKTIEAINAQVNRQLQKQISSGKYLPETFIETGDQKDNLRYLCDSIFYSEKCFEESNILDFRYLNVFLAKKNHLSFNYDFTQLKPKKGELTISSSNEVFSKWYNYLFKKQQEVIDIKISSNEKSKFEYKFSDRIDDLKFLLAKVALITESAGQGKTNFLCDFTENFLLKRKIPTVFLTGAEINAKDLRQSIIQKVFPDSPNYTFQEFLYTLKEVCYAENKFFVLVIDGINENYNSQLLSQNLETFISEILEYDFIKIVISCRTEYYEQNFSNFGKASFTNTINKIPSLIIRRTDDDIKKKIFDIYFRYFNIGYSSISNKAHEQLVENFLLLRIFCEAYQNQKLEIIENIYKEELFDKYYTIKSDEINKRLKSNDEFKVSGNFDIRNFIQGVVEFMIQEKTYVNVPLDKIISDSKDREMYVRFLDENILIKRDIQSDEKGIFTSSEVVNFTFDEFRDFLISRYLIEVLYKKSKDEFTTFLKNQITENSPILEGCSSFLFFASRRSKNEKLNDILFKQPWFDAVFSNCIFSIKDSQITLDDKKLLSEKIIKNEKYSGSIIWNLIIRYNTNYYKNMNIELLFEILREFNQKQYSECFISKFSTGRWENNSEIMQEDLVSQINHIIEGKKSQEAKYYEKLFELLVYMFANNNRWSILDVYEKYYFRYTDQGKKQLETALNSKNETLIKLINHFMESYEISL